MCLDMAMHVSDSLIVVGHIILLRELATWLTVRARPPSNNRYGSNVTKAQSTNNITILLVHCMEVCSNEAPHFSTSILMYLHMSNAVFAREVGRYAY